MLITIKTEMNIIFLTARNKRSDITALDFDVVNRSLLKVIMSPGEGEMIVAV